MIELIDAPSPNFDARRAPPDVIVLHYTEQESVEQSLHTLRTANSGGPVSSHYLVGDDGIVIVLYDSDDDDPATAVATTREHLAESSCEALVLVAVREYEAWLLAGIESLRGTASIAEDASFLGDPESPRNPAGKLEEQMTESYKKTLHQARFTGRLDLEKASERSPSLRTFITEFTEALRRHS